MCFFVNSIPFLLITPKNVGVMSSALLTNEKRKTFHQKNAFEIQQLDVDLEFRWNKDEVMTLVNLHDKNLHVHPAERAISSVKERIRCSIQGLSFNCLPISLVDRILKENVSSLNDFLRKNDISKHLSPITIVSNSPKTDFNLLK